MKTFESYVNEEQRTQPCVAPTTVRDLMKQWMLEMMPHDDMLERPMLKIDEGLPLHSVQIR